MRCALCTMLYGKSDSDSEECDMCEGIGEEIDKFTELMLEASRDYEFDTFSMGTKIYDSIEKRENGSEGRFKREFNEQLRVAFENRSGKTYAVDSGDLYFLVDARFDWVQTSARPVFIYGRYNKLSRELPQTKKLCPKCEGRGCYYCEGKGKLFEESVEELIGKVFIERFRAIDTKFHGMGREDIDVRMLGNGRPFVIELVEPRIRDVDLEMLEKEFIENDKIRIRELAYSDFAEVVRIKSAKPRKIYAVEALFDERITREELEIALKSISGKEVHQRTPLRVLQRRSDLVRTRKIFRAEMVDFSAGRARIEIESESGTYIKELIHGDKGRTVPSLAALLNCNCRVESLDVIRIEEVENAKDVTREKGEYEESSHEEDE